MSEEQTATDLTHEAAQRIKDECKAEFAVILAAELERVNTLWADQFSVLAQRMETSEQRTGQLISDQLASIQAQLTSQAEAIAATQAAVDLLAAEEAEEAAEESAEEDREEAEISQEKPAQSAQAESQEADRERTRRHRQTG